MSGLLATAVVAVPAGAVAQPIADLPIDSFRPAVDSRGYLTINATQTLGHGELSFGLGSLAWGHRVLALGTGTDSLTVDHVITATLIGAVGARVGPVPLQLGASVPISILDGSNDAQGLGNIGLHLKTRVRSSARTSGIGVGLIASVFLPTVRPTARLLGDRGVTPQLIGILDRAVLRGGRLRVALNGGVRMRRDTQMLTAGGDAVVASTEAPLGVGVAFGIRPQRLDVVGEIFGVVPLGAHAGYQPVEAIAGLKLYLARNSYLAIGGGRGLARGQGANPAVRAFIGIVFEPRTGDRAGTDLDDEPDVERDRRNDGDRDRDGDRIVDTADACPDAPEDVDDFEDTDGCPELDNDRDTILDVDDLCPGAPEDRDHFEDEDGCPDPDNDRDRIVDTDDHCPLQPESYNAFEDSDGCPDRHGVALDGGVMIVLEPIKFETNSAVIKPSSFHVLDAVVATMAANPDLLLVEVAGHTDERGDDAYNLDLSVRRAAAVVAYLIAHGVAADRLDSQGYGETLPIENAHTERAWAKNRRVAFLIIKRAS